MTGLTLSFLRMVVLGLGATLTFDLWALFLKRAFGIPPSNLCLVGRWLRYMPEGTFTHATILSSPEKRGECTTGWVAHYTIGILFAAAFVALAGSDWLRHPTPVPALLFSIVTIAAPFFVMQPAFGFGLAGSRAPKPAQVRLRSLMNHAVFGVGLYLFGLLLGPG